MDGSDKSQQLYRELGQVEDELRPRVRPCDANDRLEMTTGDHERYASLEKRRYEIVSELVALAGGGFSR